MQIYKKNTNLTKYHEYYSERIAIFTLFFITFAAVMKFMAIIQARYASTRFPGKPLAVLGGKTVIQRVYEQVNNILDEVYVATDDQRIYDCVEGFGGHAVMTRKDHQSGTDRIEEAVEKIQSSADVIINVQGDEPFIQPEQIISLMQCFDDVNTHIATLVKPFDSNDSFSALENPNTAKVVIDENNNALYFSRSVIPYIRGVEKELWPSKHQYYTHLGMYAYRADVLKQITSIQPSTLEIAESLEQLRWLQNGLNIKVDITNHSSIGIDSPQDLERAELYLSNNS